MQALPVPGFTVWWNHTLHTASGEGSKGTVPEHLLITRLYKALSLPPHCSPQQLHQVGL